MSTHDNGGLTRALQIIIEEKLRSKGITPKTTIEWDDTTGLVRIKGYGQKEKTIFFEKIETWNWGDEYTEVLECDEENGFIIGFWPGGEDVPTEFIALNKEDVGQHKYIRQVDDLYTWVETVVPMYVMTVKNYKRHISITSNSYGIIVNSIWEHIDLIL